VDGSSARGGSRLWTTGPLCLLLVLSVLVTVPGCGGCRSDPQAKTKEEKEKEKKDKEKKKKEEEEKEFELGPALSLPHDPPASDPKKQQSRCFYKPGHWTATSMGGQANKADFLGELEQQSLDQSGQPLHLEAVPFDLASTREITMPKKQRKTFESLLFVPATGKAGWAEFRIKNRGGGRLLFQERPMLRRMPSYQYHFVVLSDLPERYAYVPKLDSVKPPWESMLSGRDDKRDQHYLVEFLPVQPGRRPALPSHALFWTSIAYVLWDDADPTALSIDQQVALLDWLHWGGQLILSGPRTLESLQSSFLKDYLPVTVATGEATSRKLGSEDFAALNDHFAPSVRGRPGPRLEPVQPWEAVRVKLHPEARPVPGTGKEDEPKKALLFERRVGRGRVVASVFRLSGRELTGWDGFDGFFNACVLGRPPRTYRIGQEGQLQVLWADRRVHRLDAALTTGLRYFSRDTDVTFRQYGVDVLHAESEEAGLGQYNFGAGSAGPPPGTGLAAWNDFNATAKAARESLSKSARIEIPDRSFVVWVLVAYLLVLVPANWVIFRAIDRVEWAWAAAPLIAILCTVVVIRLAQLDIGFARSVTEIGVLEVQGGYPRAHLTRYTALYTSLSTSYDLKMEEAGGQIQPFPTVDTPSKFRLQLGEGYDELEYRHGNEVSVPGYRVRSNSTRFLHSEQMVDLDGALVLVQSADGDCKLTNETGLTLRDAGVVRKAEDDSLQAAWLGTLQPGAAVPVDFGYQPGSDGGAELWPERREGSPVTASRVPSGQLTLRDLVELAQDTKDLRPGQVRLIGWLDEEMPGLVIDPSAPQAQRATLLIAHLRYGFQHDPKPDARSRADAERVPRRETTPW